MFESVCMTCGRLLDDERRIYCSNGCESSDFAAHPSTESSVSSSPFLTASNNNTIRGGDFPPLMLPKKRTASSTSSDVTSILEYDDSDIHQITSSSSSAMAPDEVKSENMFHLPPLGIIDNGQPISVSVKVASPRRRTPISALSPLSFARRPGSGDVRGLVPALHTQSRSTPATPSPEASPVQETSPSPPPSPISTPKKRSRASLPAYFSHLTLTSHSKPSPPTLSHINVHVDVTTKTTSDDKLATPKASARHHLRGKSEQLNRRRTDWLREDLWDDVPVLRTTAVAVPGSTLESTPRERGRGRSRTRGPGPELLGEERRGRSRIVTPRKKIVVS